MLFEFWLYFVYIVYFVLYRNVTDFLWVDISGNFVYLSDNWLVRYQLLEVEFLFYWLQLGLVLLAFMMEMFYNLGHFFPPKSYIIATKTCLCKYKNAEGRLEGSWANE